MARDAPAGRNSAVVPAFRVDGVEAVELDFAAVDLVSDGADQAAVFKFVKAALGSGEYDERDPVVAVDEEFHFAAEAGRPPFVIFAVHCGQVVKLRYRKASESQCARAAVGESGERPGWGHRARHVR